MERSRTTWQALVPFGTGSALAAAVCALVMALPDPRREGMRSRVTVKSTTPPMADASVSLSGRTLLIHNRGPAGTGPITLALHPAKGSRLSASCAGTGCSWPDLPSGQTVEVRLRGRGGGQATVSTTVPDRTPRDNEIRLPRLRPAAHSRGGARPHGPAPVERPTRPDHPHWPHRPGRPDHQGRPGRPFHGDHSGPR